MLLEQGARLGTVLEYAHMLLPIEVETDESWINHNGMVSELGIDLLIPLQVSPGYFRFMPGPEFSPRLYRGQNQFHKQCTPSLYRPEIKNIDALFWIAKYIELSAVLERHQATQDLAAYQLEGLRFAFRIEAIAQHYQYPTQLLDFSRSKDVAMFFATCAYKNDVYTPLRTGTAVLYTVDLRELILQRSGIANLLPLGMEPLPRPEAQRALAVRLNYGENLNDMPWARCSNIEITPELSQRYFEMFDGGKKLFPENPFDDHIKELRTNRTVPLQALEFCFKQGLLPIHSHGVSVAHKGLIAAGYAVEDRAVAVCPVVIQAAKDEWATRKADYFGRVRMRAVCDHLVLD